MNTKLPSPIRIVKLLIFAAVAAATLIALVHAWLDFTGRRELARTKAELIAKGEKLSFPEFAPPAIPDEVNFFAAPIWKEQIAWAQSMSRERPVVIVTRQDGPIGTTKRLPDGNPWYQGIGGSPFHEGRLTDLDALAQTLSAEDKAPADSAAERVLAAIAEREPYLPQVEQAAERPAGIYPLDYGKGFELGLPHLSSVQNIVLSLRFRAVARMAAGDPAGAARDISLMLKMSHYLEPEPILVTHLVRVSVIAMAVYTFWECMARGDWTEAELASIQRQFAQPDLVQDYARALRAERAVFNAMGSAGFGKDQWLLIHGMSRSSDLKAPKPYPLLLGPLYPRGLVHMDVAHYNRSLQSLIDLTSSDTPNAAPQIFAALASQPSSRWKHPLTSVAFPGIYGTAERFFDMQNMLRLAQIACAVERHRLANGDFPQRLDELMPKFLDAVPVNASTKEPFEYERLSPINYRISTPAVSKATSVKHMTRDGNFVWIRQPAAENRQPKEPSQ